MIYIELQSKANKMGAAREFMNSQVQNTTHQVVF